ncbi:MAG: peptide deformylase [Armatimonadota bacterium]|nr:peptide deformylase [Armatimonadota bacterium]
MAEREIVKYGENVLKQRAEEVERFDDSVRALIEEMYQVMEENHGLGLAAPQIGVPKRVFVYDSEDGPHALINPRLIKGSGEQISVEGCLSIPGLQGEVKRYETVTVEGLNENGKKVRIRAQGLLARVFQHEMDHLDGTLFVDKADPDTLQLVGQEEVDVSEE